MRSFSLFEMQSGMLYIEIVDEALVALKMVQRDNFMQQNVAFKMNYAHKRVHQQLREYFEGRRKSFTLPVAFESGTPFQQKVWRSTLNIPYGQTRTYQEIAVDIGSPKAYRAVGNALNNNPLLVVVPCHRVVGKNGKLTGYALGLEMKAFLIDVEQNN